MRSRRRFLGPILTALLALTALTPALSVALTGAPDPSESGFDYGSQAVDTTVIHNFTLTNNTGEPLVLISRTVTDSTNFGVTNDDCDTLTPLADGESCSFVALFTPSSIGAKAGSIIYDYGGDDVAQVDLSGIGIDISLSDAIYNYGTHDVGTGTSHTFTITNNTGGDINAVSRSNDNAGNFVFGTDDCFVLASLADGDSCTFEVVFSPDSAGAKNAVIVQSYDVGDVTLNVYGDSKGPAASPTPVPTATPTPAPATPTPVPTATPTPAVPAPDISLTKSDSPDPVEPGGLLTYTIIATNNGPGTPISMTIADTLPAGTSFVAATGGSPVTPDPAPGAMSGTITHTFPGVGVGMSVVLTLVVAVNAGTPDGTIITNTAIANSCCDLGVDPNLENNAATETTTVATAATPTPVVTASPTPVPTASPTPAPTASPTPVVTASPTPAPTASPTPVPTASPTPAPTASPTPAPTASPTPEPTASPTPEPTASPTPEPTASPTPEPTASPTPEPTDTPAPTDTPEPTATPEGTPTPTPEATPTPTAQVTPTPAHSNSPTPGHTNKPPITAAFDGGPGQSLPVSILILGALLFMTAGLGLVIATQRRPARR